MVVCMSIYIMVVVEEPGDSMLDIMIDHKCSHPLLSCETKNLLFHYNTTCVCDGSDISKGLNVLQV